MGVLDTVARALIEVKADVGDAKAKLKDLQGAEKQLAQERIKGMQEANDGLDKWIGRLAKAGLALNALGQVAGFVGESVKAYGETLRLESAAGATNIGKLQDAFDGLVNKHDALTFAAQTQHGVIKLNQEQQETFAKAMVALTNAGFDQQEVFNKLKDAAVSLKTEGLDDLGVSVVAGKTNAEKLKNTLAALNEVIKQNHEPISTEAEDIQRLSVAYDNAKLSVQSFVGASLSLSNATKGRGLVAFSGDSATGGAFGGASQYLREAQAVQTLDQAWSKLSDDFDKFDYKAAHPESGGGLKFFEDLADDARRFEYGLTQTGDKLAIWGEKAKQAYDKARAAARALAEQQKALSNAVARSLTDDLVTRLEAEAHNENMPDELRDQRTYYDKLKTDSKFAIDIPGILGMKSPEPTKKENKLEKIFGPLDDFDAYKSAFDALTGAVGSAYEAWVTGSESAGTAVKKFLGNMLLGVGKQMAIEAIKYEAYALASLVPGPFFNPAAASGYALTGAAFAAGAIAAGVAAHELGAGGSTAAPKGSGGASAGGSAGGGSSGNAQPQQGPIIVYSDPFAEMTGRQRQLQARKLVSKALGNSAVEEG